MNASSEREIERDKRKNTNDKTKDCGKLTVSRLFRSHDTL